MVRTSILVEVDEKVNDLVVVPHKRSKTFSKLMASLLSGYVEDPYIRAYADGTVDDMRRASVDVLDDALNSMSESLSMMGVYSSELKTNTNKGMSDFKQYSENKAQEIKEREVSDEEVSELKDAVSALKKQNEDILSILQSLTLGSLSNQISQVTSSTESIGVGAITKSETNLSTDSAPDIISYSSDKQKSEDVMMPKEEVVVEKTVAVEEFYEEDEESADASALLGSLMSGNQYSF